MSGLLQIAPIGKTAKANALRAIRDGKKYENLFPKMDWKETVVRKNGDVIEVVNQIIKIIFKYKDDSRQIAPLLKSSSKKQTCENIWNFLFDHINYKEDEKGREQLRRPARSFAERKRGVDCDDFTIAASTLLLHHHIPHLIRIARYKGVDHFQHVYVIAFPDGEKVFIDPVLDSFNQEEPAVETKDFNVMENSTLGGIDIAVLSGLEQEAGSELFGVLSGSDLEEVFKMEGLGQTPSKEEHLQALYNHLTRTRNLLEKNPGLVKGVEDPQTFLKMLDYALRYWNTDKRDEALAVLIQNEQKFNIAEGLGEAPEGTEVIDIFYSKSELSGVCALGKIKKKRGFFKSIAQAVKNAGQGIKKAGQAVIRYNPLSLAARGGVLLAMKINLNKLAGKLKWGYLTKEEAQDAGVDMEQWQKSKDALDRTERMFVNVLKGQAENLKRAILEGKAGGLEGIGLGVEPVSTATTTAAATGFLAKIASWVKGIDLKKMAKRINPLKLLKKKKKEVKPEEPTTEEKTPMDETSTTEKISVPMKETPSLPPPPDEGFLQKSFNWVKEHPGSSLLIGGGLALLLFPKARKAVGLSGTKGGKKKRKPPQVLTGKKRSKPKKRSLKVVKL